VNKTFAHDTNFFRQSFTHFFTWRETAAVKHTLQQVEVDCKFAVHLGVCRVTCQSSRRAQFSTWRPACLSGRGCKSPIFDLKLCRTEFGDIVSRGLMTLTGAVRYVVEGGRTIFQEKR
jgi:hypothetical protein